MYWPVFQVFYCSTIHARGMLIASVTFQTTFSWLMPIGGLAGVAWSAANPVPLLPRQANEDPTLSGRLRPGHTRAISRLSPCLISS